MAAGGAQRPDPLVPIPVTVRRRRRESPDTWSLQLERAGPWPPSLPGQFNMLYAPGVGEAAISISGEPGRNGLLMHTIRSVGAVSRALGDLRPGQQLGLRGPFGVGWPVGEEAEGRDVLLVAGGLGLAPLRPALRALLDRRRSLGALALVYGTRGPPDLLFRGELARWRRDRRLQCHVTVDQAGPEWQGEIGVVTRLLPRLVFRPGNALALLCGPEIMMRRTAAALRDQGVPESAIFLSMERNMKCALGQCGRCQFGPSLICRDGPVLRYDQVRPLLVVREI